MHDFARELRQAWRSLLHRKAYFVTCAVTLTLVFGANAAMFAVVNATILRPMPFATASAVLHVFNQPPGTTSVLQRNPLQQMEVPRLRERARTLARLEGFYLFERVVTIAGEPGVAQGAAVTPGLLTMMAAPIAGAVPRSHQMKRSRGTSSPSSAIAIGATRLARRVFSALRW